MKPGGFNLKTPEACLTILMTKNSQDFFKIMFVPLFKVVKGVFSDGWVFWDVTM